MFNKLILGKISDEEVAKHEWVLCPNCNVNVMKEDLIGNDYCCPNCHAEIQKEVV